MAGSTTANLATNTTGAPIPTVSSNGEFSNSAKIGLGIGIGVGVAAVVAAAILTWYHIKSRAVGPPTPAGGNGDPDGYSNAGKPAVVETNWGVAAGIPKELDSRIIIEMHTVENEPVEMHGSEHGAVEMYAGPQQPHPYGWQYGGR